MLANDSNGKDAYVQVESLAVLQLCYKSAKLVKDMYFECNFMFEDHVVVRSTNCLLRACNRFEF